MIALYPTAAQIEALAAESAGRPVVMLNLLRFRERASAPDEGMSGREAYQRYGAGVRPLIERYGGEILWAGRVDRMVIGSCEEGFDAIALVRYPSRQKFLEMAADPELAQVSVHRAAGLEGQWLIAATDDLV